MAPDISIDSTSDESENDDVNNPGNTEPEEFCTTHDLFVGKKIEVCWPLDGKFYHGSISE